LREQSYHWRKATVREGGRARTKVGGKKTTQKVPQIMGPEKLTKERNGKGDGWGRNEMSANTRGQQKGRSAKKGGQREKNNPPSEKVRIGK